MKGNSTILLIFANDRQAYLESILEERQHLQELLQPAVDTYGYEVNILDYSTVENLIEVLNIQQERLIALHFAGHSNTDLLRLDEGEAYAPGLAAKLGACPNLKLVFLNGCRNAPLIKAIADAGVPMVIATHRSINDTQATRFARELYASLLEDSRQVALQAAFTRAGSKGRLSEVSQARSMDIDTLKQDDAPSWDWSLFPRDPQALDWTLRELLTHERPRFDANGELLNPHWELEAFREEDRAYFFGREALSGELCDKIPAIRLFERNQV